MRGPAQFVGSVCTDQEQGRRVATISTPAGSNVSDQYALLSPSLTPPREMKPFAKGRAAIVVARPRQRQKRNRLGGGNAQCVTAPKRHRPAHFDFAV